MSKRSAEEENVCSFFLSRKKKPCRMKTQDGMSFCPHHSHLDTEQDPVKGIRIPCPFDPSHFCYESKLQKHLKKCNAREKEKPEYYVENINLDLESSKKSKLSLNDVSDEELLELIKRVETLYESLDIVTSETTSMHPTLEREMEVTDDGLNTFKHLKQQGSLLEVMEKQNFLKNSSCFVEFGAGKGQLMYWIIKCASDAENTAFILVDRSAQRHKSDNKFKGTEILLQRIRIDIQHLHLGKIPTLKDKLNRVVGVSKHLCGAATDLAIKCMANTLEQDSDGAKVKLKAFGLLMALCCHHRCSWDSYIGKQYFENFKLSEREFQLLCCMASWATCGLRKTEHHSETTAKENEEIPEDNVLNRYKKLNLSHEEREVIGMKCKRLIDAGRVLYLQKEGYEVELITYTDKSVSLENVALLATHKES
ncbi:tRNA:m(4)X modification enzyme TRM13 homolog isoform X2 [Parasteatoda tepidariorum]|uniref:tRNA:m(4)X modification enzyme TRM13 homolog isoform X2 n=1 Tax=Parasteatoda tepidariorum TaxID=114398 RepID=UPI001C727B93|nr:tRNA:m(4)X modification enzyme TRM13 homolog isoform X2 [Parasteatoda tepidariorum]